MGVEFDAAGARHLLRFDFNALCRIEEDFGAGMADIAGRLQGQPGKPPRLSDIRLAFRAGLGTGYTVEQAGDLIGEIGAERAATLIGEALQRAFPDREAGATGSRRGGKPRAG
jgi:hypothetical protein